MKNPKIGERVVIGHYLNPQTGTMFKEYEGRTGTIDYISDDGFIKVALDGEHELRFTTCGLWPQRVHRLLPNLSFTIKAEE